MIKHFNKKFVMTKKDVEDFENSTKCWNYDNAYIDGDVKVRDHCHTLEVVISRLSEIKKFLLYFPT